MEYKKYIIEVDDEVHIALDGRKYHFTSQGERFIILDSILKNLTPYETINELTYQQGVKDGWEAAGKILLQPFDDGMLNVELSTIFRELYKDDATQFYKDISPLKAVEKLKEYENNKFNVEKEMIYEFCDKTGYDLDELYKLIKKMRKEQYDD
jgi:hypothetical protein